MIVIKFNVHALNLVGQLTGVKFHMIPGSWGCVKYFYCFGHSSLSFLDLCLMMNSNVPLKQAGFMKLYSCKLVVVKTISVCAFD